MASACAGMVSAASLSARQVNGVRARQPVRASPRPRSASFRARVATRRARGELFPRDVDVGPRRASARVGGATRARTRPARRERIRGRADASVAPPTIRGGVSASTRARASGPFSAHLASPRPRSKLTLLSTPPSRIRFARRSARRSRSRRTRCVPPRPRSFPRARADSRGRPNAPPTVSPRPRPSRAGTAASAFRTGDDAESSDAPHRPRASNFYAVETFAARTQTTTR